MGMNVVPGNPANFIISSFLVATIFQYYIFRKHYGWWEKYNYVLSSALDTGAAFASLFIFFALSKKFIPWWGNNLKDAEMCTFG